MMNSKLILLVLVLLSVILAFRLILYFANSESYLQGQLLTFETTIQSQPKSSSRSQRVSLILPNSQRAVVQFPLKPILSYGDRLRLEGKIQYFKAQNGHRIAFIDYPKILILKKGIEGSLILKVRESIINFFNSSLSPIQSSLMLGIVFGIKQEIPSGFYANLQKTGLLHVIAASGMNISMVGGFLVGIFGLIFKRQLALILSILGILLYVLMAGLEPSIVRASIMGILVFGAQLVGRQNSSFLGLFAAVFVMLFLNPSLLLDLGFQLSFMATLGLIYFRPLFFLNKKIKYLIEKSLLGEDLVTTITAQIFTLPILLVNFGNYSLVSILVNGILLWTVPLLMIIGGLASIFGLLFQPLGRLIAYLSVPLLFYFEKIVNLFAGLGGKFEINNLSVLIICGYYLILVSLVLFIREKR